MQRIDDLFISMVRTSASVVCVSCVAFCLLIAVTRVGVRAEVVGHWRLEPGNDFFTDSVGDADLATSFGPVEPVSLPSDDRGVSFPKDLTDIGPNRGAAHFGSEVAELISENAPLIDDDFTIETYANVHNFSASQMSAHLVAQTNPANASGRGGLSEFGWTLHVRMDRHDGSEPRELFLVTSDGHGWQHIKSRILIDENKDYFMAAAFDLDPGEATFYVHDLKSNRLQINTVRRPSPHVPLNATEHFAIGGFETEPFRHRLHGVVDEVRLSEGIVEFGDLLTGQNVSPDSVPLQVELGPKALYVAREQSSARDARLASRTFIDDSRRLLAKFDLPEISGASLKLDEAKIRFHVDSVAGAETAELSLWHSPTDGDFSISDDSFLDESYVDTGRHAAVGEADDVVEFVEIDVTDLVRHDYFSDVSNAVSAFRVQAAIDSRFRLNTGNSIDRRPQLLITINQNLGDFNNDGSLSVADINQLATGIRAQDATFDINRDGFVDQQDVSDWVQVLNETWIGDVNLDGEFNSSDLVEVFQADQYEDGIPMNSGWAEGDWNGDGDFDSGDLVFAFQDGGYEKGMRAAQTMAVPEPGISLWLMLTAIALITSNRRFSSDRQLVSEFAR